MSDDRRIFQVQTVPPPPGEADAYSAPTKVGAMASAIVSEMVEHARRRAEGELAPPSGPAPPVLEASASLESTTVPPPPEPIVAELPPTPEQAHAFDEVVVPTIAADSHQITSEVIAHRADASLREQVQQRPPSLPPLHLQHQQQPQPLLTTVGVRRESGVVRVLVLLVTVLALAAAGYFFLARRYRRPRP